MRLETPDPRAPKPPSRRAIALSFFTAGYALALQPAAATAIETDAQGLEISEPTLPGEGGFALPAYCARPQRAGAHAAILVVNEVFGVHAYIKDVCRRLAKQGFVALAPDYFRRAGDPSIAPDFAAIAPIVAATPVAQVMGDTQGALSWLRAQPFVNGARLGVTGFCWGGAVVWSACAQFEGLKAGVAWYGRLAPPAPGAFGDEPHRRWPLDFAGELKCPVLGLYGGRDQGISVASVEAMRRALAANGNPTGSQVILYPEAEHGFHADYRPSYNAHAAQDGWARMLAWFREQGVR
ncbi:MAG: dienelactone hydrolase family protein [Hyphomonadaceae bacterium]